jgi:hypothetical protein
MSCRKILRGLFVCILVAGGAVNAANTPKPAATLKSELSDLFKGKTARLVWQKDVEGGWPGMPSSLPQPVNRLLKMNSADGTVSEFIGATKGYKCRPTFTWDGSRVVFTDLNSKTLYAAKWNDGTTTQIAAGFENGGCYYFENKHRVLATNSSGQIYRINIDSPGEKVQISCPKKCLWPSVSPDGKFLAGLYPTWGHAGVMDMTSGTVREFSNPSGCWPTMFRDNSHYTLYTIEPHRNYRVVDPTEKQIFNKPVGEELLPGDNEYNILRGTPDPDIITFMIVLPGNNPYIERISDGRYVFLNTGTENPNEGNMDIFFDGSTDAVTPSPGTAAQSAWTTAVSADRIYDVAGRATTELSKVNTGVYVRASDRTAGGKGMMKFVP